MKKKIIENQFNKYLQIYHFTEEDKPLLKELKKNTNNTEIEMTLCSEDFFNFLLYESDLDIETKTNITINHQNLITNFPKNKEIHENGLITGINQVFEFYKQNLNSKAYNFQTQFYGKTLPILVHFEMINAARGIPRHISIKYQITLCSLFPENRVQKLYHKDITQAKAKHKKIVFYDLLKEFGLYKLSIDIEEYKQTLEKTNQIKTLNGAQFLNKLYVLENHYKNGFSKYSLSINDSFSKIIIESELGLEQKFNNDTYANDDDLGLNSYYTTPYVRVFALSQKRYFFIHIEDLLPYQYDKEAFSKLIIPEETRRLLSGIFNSNIKDYYSDFIKTKHGGMVLLAEGPTGVGKTSTAEVYAELLEKPLYMTQLDELGTSANEMENNLTIIFKRVQKWNAVLLFDEIDVYLYRRENDLKQSAIVGVFLRLLDYFSGLIFFTTNRSSVLDSAILSRISLKIKYENLNQETQLEVWKSKLKDAQVSIDSTQILSSLNLNGRQIKNTIRVAKVLYGNNFKENEVVNLIEKYII